MIRSFRHKGLKRLFAGDPNGVHASFRDKVENILAFLSTRSGNGARLVSTQHGMPEYAGGGRNGKYRILQK